MSRHCPPGYMTKAEAAERLGISTKTLDRRRKFEDSFGSVLLKGRQVLFPISDVEAYFELCKQRGRI